MEPRLKSTRLIDGEVKGIMDNHHYHSIKLSESDSISSAMFSFSAACTFLTPIFNFHVVVFETICAI